MPFIGELILDSLETGVSAGRARQCASRTQPHMMHTLHLALIRGSRSALRVMTNGESSPK